MHIGGYEQRQLYSCGISILLRRLSRFDFRPHDASSYTAYMFLQSITKQCVPDVFQEAMMKQSDRVICLGGVYVCAAVVLWQATPIIGNAFVQSLAPVFPLMSLVFFSL